MTPEACTGAAPEPGVDERLRFLCTPGAHAGHAPGATAVERLETHMSWVFLVGGHALKLKKRVRYPFLDFSTLAAREFHCREELRLNRRLAPGVYLGLVELRWADGRLRLQREGCGDTRGRVLDWLVLMRRLPAERMLDRLLARQAVSSVAIDALADTLARFYAAAPRARCTADEYLARMREQQALTRAVLLRPRFALRDAGPALDRLDQAMARHAGLLGERVAARRLVDGHGDLRPEHVCLVRPPVVIDALEFNPALRQVDPFSELCFLGLECELAGAAWIGPRLMQRCASAWGDLPPPALLALYAADRALLRARLAAAHLLEQPCRTPGRWLPLAQRYLARALRILEGGGDAWVVSAATPCDRS